MKFQSLVRRFVTYYESMAREFALNVKQINKACDWFRATLVCHIYIPLPEHSTVWTVCKRSTFHYLMKLFSGVKRNFPPPHSTVPLPPHTLSGVVRVWCLVRLCIWFVWISQCVKLSLKDRFIFFSCLSCNSTDVPVWTVRWSSFWSLWLVLLSSVNFVNFFLFSLSLV